MNSIIISIRPEWAVKEMNGEKTEEIRKNIGKLKPPFKVYAYVTKGKPYLYKTNGHNSECFTYNPDDMFIPKDDKGFGGKVCFEFVCDRVLKLDQEPDYETSYQKIAKGSCLSFNDYYMYATWARNAIVYALHISELKVYDTPKELGEFYHYKKKTVYSGMDCPPYVDEVKVPLTRAFQSWGYVEEK